MHFICGNQEIARHCLRNNPDGSTSPLRIAQRMRLEHSQLEGVQRKMQLDHEHCILVALPCGRDENDVLDQSLNLSKAFISYLQQKQAAGIVNVAHQPSDLQVKNANFFPNLMLNLDFLFQPAYVVHIFPACEFATSTLARAAPKLLPSISPIPHLLIIIATVV